MGIYFAPQQQHLLTAFRMVSRFEQDRATGIDIKEHVKASLGRGIAEEISKQHTPQVEFDSVMDSYNYTLELAVMSRQEYMDMFRLLNQQQEQIQELERKLESHTVNGKKGMATTIVYHETGRGI